MSECLNCKHWQRIDDPIIGTCLKPEIPGEAYRFQYERCQYYEAGEMRKPYNEREFARRVRDYSDVQVEPEIEAQIVEMLKQGVMVKEIRDRLHIGAQVMSAITRRHKEEHEAGRKLRIASQPDPLDAYAAEFKRLLDDGASYYRIQMVTGVNRQRVSSYVQRKGLMVTE